MTRDSISRHFSIGLYDSCEPVGIFSHPGDKTSRIQHHRCILRWTSLRGHKTPSVFIPLDFSNNRYLFSIGAYGHDTPISKSSLPDNPAAAKLAVGLAAAHIAYGNPAAIVLFLVSEPEENIFDQRWIEYRLQEDHGIQSRRITLSQLGEWGKLDSKRNLLIPTAMSETEMEEVSVVYLRVGYGPADYPSQREWGARRMMELSRAIKCPTVITQLAGCKKIQQVLANPGVLERYSHSSRVSRR